MQTRFGWMLIGSVSLACGTPGDAFSEAEVLAFAVEGELKPSRIDRAQKRIDVTMKSQVALQAAVLEKLEISSRAEASIRIGDSLDLSDRVRFTVEAENGVSAEWIVQGAVGKVEGDGDDDEDPSIGAGGAGACDSEVLSYQLSGSFEITDTALGAGDGVHTVGPGALKLRLTKLSDGSVEARLLSYEMTQQFTAGNSLARVRTDNQIDAGPKECGLALGTLKKDVIEWAACDYGSAPPLGTKSWSWSDVVGGPGCMNGYHTKGRIECSGAFCGAAGVDFPLDVDETYPQPLNHFEFSSDKRSFEMKDRGAPQINAGRGGVEVPSSEPSRTWLGLQGTLLSRSCEPAPTCE